VVQAGFQIQESTEPASPSESNDSQIPPQPFIDKTTFENSEWFQPWVVSLRLAYCWELDRSRLYHAETLVLP